MSDTTITFEVVEECVVGCLRGEIDLANVHSLGEAIFGAAGRPTGGVVLDLTGVGYMDSAGLALIFEISRRLETARLRLALVVPPGSPLHRLMEIAQVREVAAVVPDVPSAVAEACSPLP